MWVGGGSLFCSHSGIYSSTSKLSRPALASCPAGYLLLQHVILSVRVRVQKLSRAKNYRSECPKSNLLIRVAPPLGILYSRAHEG